MGHWVTLDDDQRVYISDGGKVLATRAAISKASGGTERGKALAARSKAAILKKKAGGAAKPAGSGSIADRMTASADAAKTRADAAKASGNRTAELSAHEHRALILAKQAGYPSTHKSGQGQTAPGTERTAAAEAVARTRAARSAPTATAKPSLREQADAARAAKGSAAERASALREKVNAKSTKVLDELRKTDNAKNRFQGPQEKYQKLIARGSKAEAEGNRLAKASKNLTGIEKQTTPEKFGMVRGSAQRKDLAERIKAARANVGNLDKKIMNATHDPNAEAVHKAGLWGEIGQNRGASARQVAQNYARYDKQAKTVIPLAKEKQGQESTIKALRAKGRSLQPPARATAPGVAKATGRGTPERATRAAQIVAERKAGNLGSASALTTKNRPLGIEKRQAEATANRITRNTHNAELVKEHLEKGGQTLLPSYVKPMIVKHAGFVHGVDKRDGSIMVQEGKRSVAIPRGSAEGTFVRPARLAKAAELRAQRAAATAKPAAEPATIGHKPGESFSLIQRSATRSGPSAVNTGKGTTKFMFDMNKRDKPGQTSMFDKPESKPAPSPPAKPSLREQAAASRLGSRADREDAADTLRRARSKLIAAKSLEAKVSTTTTDQFGKEIRSKPTGTEAAARARLETLRKTARKELGYKPTRKAR